MTDTAYLLISLNRSTPAAVAREVRKLAGVMRADVTMGEYDVVAIVELEGTKGFPAIAGEIQRIEGVTKVSACVIVTP